MIIKTPDEQIQEAMLKYLFEPVNMSTCSMMMKDIIELVPSDSNVTLLVDKAKPTDISVQVDSPSHGTKIYTLAGSKVTIENGK